MAAERATLLHGNHEVVSLSRRGLAAAGLLPEGPARADRELSLLLALGNAETALHGWTEPEAERAFARARVLSERASASAALFAAVSGLYGFYYVRADFGTARALAERLLEIASRLADPMLAAHAHWLVGAAHFNVGELTAARPHLERAIGLHDPTRASRVAVELQVDVGAGGSAYLDLLLTLLGYPDQAVRAGQTALRLARDLSHPFTLAYTLSQLASAELFRRDAVGAEAHAAESLDLCGQHEFLGYSRMVGSFGRGRASAPFQRTSSLERSPRR